MRREHGLQIGYWTAWRAKEAAFANINGSHESVFSQLPQYCEDIIRSNPGSTAIVERTPDDCFLRMFVSYAASGKGFAYCHAVLGLDGSHLKSRYQGVLLAATAVDANGSLFPVSYAVVSAENDDNWSWFIDNLHNVIQMHAPTCLAPRILAFISDRQKGLLEAVETVFPGSPHGYCLCHLYENLHKSYKHKDLRSLLWEAARAVSAEAFNEAIEKMRGLCPPAVDWLLSHANPTHWCEFYFPGRRYSHLTSNIAESLNAWLLEAREKPVLAMFEQMRHQSMQWFDKRRHIDTNTEGLLVSTAAKAIQSTLNLRARRYHIISVDDNVYEVFLLETSRNYVIMVSDCTCTCWSWQSTSGHAAMLLLSVSITKRTHKHLQPRSTPSWLIGNHTATQYTLRISTLRTTPNCISLPVSVVKIPRAWICCHQALIVLLEAQRKGGFVVQLRGKVAISRLFVAVAANKLGTRSAGASSLFRLCIQQRIGGFRNAVKLVRAILVISILTRAKYANLATFRAI